MRAIRAIAVVGLIAVGANAANAQATRHFKDSWFWGLKGGAMAYQVMSDPGGGLAPMGGLDWFITRTNGGLYVSFDRTFFNQFVLVNDSVNPAVVTPGGRQVDLKDMHRFTLAGMLFPLQTYRLHPYIAFGATLNSIVEATPQGTFASPTQQKLVLATIQQYKTAASPIVMLGVQARLPLLPSAFVHLTATPAANTFFLFTNNGWRATLEAGARYNVGSSIDRMR